MKISSKIIHFVLLISSFCAYSQIEETNTLTTNTGEIIGSLLMPQLDNQVPVALIISGSGPTDRNGNNPFMPNNALKMLAEGLQQNGIASLRYDKRGIGESKAAGKSEKELRFEDYIQDAELWVEKLDSDDRFSEIIIIGHSEGSLIGMIASQKKAVDQFISLAGAGDRAGNIIREQLKPQPKTILDSALPIIDSLEAGRMVKEVNPLLNAIFRPSVQPYLISWFRYNPQEEIAKLDKPILIIQSDTDIQVGISDAEKLKKAKDDASKVIIEGMNHVLKKSELDRQKNLSTYSLPDLPLHEDLVPEIMEFLNQ